MFLETRSDRSTYNEGVVICDNLIMVHRVDQRFAHGHLLDARHVETVHVIPPCI